MKKNCVDVVQLVYNGIIEDVKVFNNRDKSNKFYEKLIKKMGYKNEDDYAKNRKENSEIYYFQDIKI